MKALSLMFPNQARDDINIETLERVYKLIDSEMKSRYN